MSAAGFEAAVLDWHDRGDRLLMLPLVGGGLTVIVECGCTGGPIPQSTAIELGAAGAAALAEAIDRLQLGHGWVPGDQLAEAEGERDDALDRARDLERDLVHCRAELERLKTALDLADTRARGAETRADALEVIVEGRAIR